MTLSNVAYFSMEMAIDQTLSVYSGGLGYLAGSHMQSAGYLGLPMVGICIQWTYGYYDQRIGNDGNVEIAYVKKPYNALTDTGVVVDVDVYGRNVKVKALRLEPGEFGTIPVYFLTTDIPENCPEDRAITHRLYDADERTRVSQEVILGVGGVRVLDAVGYKYDLIHMNEGHALPAAFELLRQFDGDLEKVKSKTVFTTHTPVAAGNEVHGVDLLMHAGFFPGCSRERAVELGGGESFSLTIAALRMSRLANAVSQLHGVVANKMWENVDKKCEIIAITNAVNLQYWQDDRIKYSETNEDLLESKLEMKAELFKHVASCTGKKFDPEVLTIVWARRFADYKRAWLILMDRGRIGKLLRENKIQIIFAGKFHPADTLGRDMFNNILKQSTELPNVAVLFNYELELSALMKKGSDVWLNTPLRPFEASGTSGMSANMNGSLHLSTFDGWSVEGTFDGINGYNLTYEGLDDDISWEERHWKDYECMMEIIENKLIPTYYNDKDKWATLMSKAIRTAAGYFNSDRMVIEYYNRLYNPIASSSKSVSNVDTSSINNRKLSSSK